MAKRILSEDTVQSDVNKGSSPTPEAKIYLPNYKGVNHYFNQAPGGAELKYSEVLAADSLQKLETQERVLNGIYATRGMSNVDLQAEQASIEWKKDKKNESGSGYTEFMLHRYQQLIDAEAENAPSSEASQYIRTMGAHSLRSVANTAVQYENQASSAFSIRSTEDIIKENQNLILRNPNRFQDYYLNITNAIDNLDGAIPSDKLAEFRKQKQEESFFIYGNGIINTNPMQASDIIKSDIFSKNLNPDNHNRLINHARSMKEYVISLARQNQREFKRSLEDASSKKCAKIVSLAKRGSDPGTQLIELEKQYNAGAIDEKRFWDTRTKLNEISAEVGKYEQSVQKIQEAIANNVPDATVSTEHKNRYLTESLNNENTRRKAAGEEPLSLMEIADEANKPIYDSQYTPLHNSLVSVIKNAGNKVSGEVLLDACKTVAKYPDMAALGKVDDDVQDFAHLAQIEYVSTGKLENIVSLKESFFKQDKAIIELRKSEWNTSDFAKRSGIGLDTQKIALNSFYKEIGWGGWWSDYGVNDLNRGMIDAYALRSLERNYIRTGSISQSKLITKQYLNTLVNVTEINGESERMINPPTMENTGFSPDQITKILDSRIRDKLTKLKQSGARIDILAKPREAMFLIDGEMQQRKIYYEGIDIERVRGNLYYLLDEKSKTSKEYLIDPKTGSRTLINFEVLKNIPYERIIKTKAKSDGSI